MFAFNELKKNIKVKTNKNEIISDDVVIAAGVFSDKLSKKFGANVPLQSERGYHLELKKTNIELKYPLFNGYLKLAIAPKPSGIRFAGHITPVRCSLRMGKTLQRRRNLSSKRPT